MQASRSRSRSSSSGSSSRHGARSPPPPPQQRRGPSRLQASSAAASASAGAAAAAHHRQHRMMLKKPPEPLRRAVAECLSATSYHTQITSAESVRTFEDYLGSPSTIHFAYTVLLEHSLAERDRSPPVILRCVSLLKRYLFRYVPPLLTLKHIDSFCITLIEECSTAAGKSGAKDASSAPPTVTSSVFASEGLVKSLVYIRAVVTRHLPQTSSTSSPHFNPLSPAPSLRNKLLSPHYGVPSDDKESSRPVVLTMPGLESVDDGNSDFIALDILNWLWIAKKGRQIWVPSPVMMDSGGIARPQVEMSDFLERGLAAVFLDTNSTSGTDNQLLRASKTLVGDANMVKSHLQAVATSKRLQPAPSYSTLRKRPRPLFQYRYYSKQQPLRLSDCDIEDVITAVCSEGGVQSSPTLPMLSSLTSGQNGVVPETANVAASVLIKLIFDMYLANPKTAAPLTLFILQGMLFTTPVTTRVRAFDLVLNLGVHAHLLEPAHSEDQDSSEDGGTPGAVAEFESWLLTVLSEMLLVLVQLEEREEGVWAAAMSTLLYLVCDRGRIRRQRLEAVDIRVLKVLLDVSRENAWAEEIHSRVIRMVANLVYRVPSAEDMQPSLDLERLEMIGGIETICREYEFPGPPEVKRNLFALILEYAILELSNKKSLVLDDFHAVAASLVLAGAPEALGMAFYHKLPGVGGKLTKSIAKALDRDIANGRLSLALLEEVTRLIDTLVDKQASLEEEFLELLSVTSTSDDAGHAVHLQGRAWATLRALLHSSRLDYRQAGYLWLSQLLSIEVQCVLSGQNDSHQFCLLKVLEQAKSEFGNEQTSAVLLLLELLCSKRSSVRQGFLIVLDRLLTQCQLAGCTKDQTAADTLVQLMNGALWQFISANDTHRVNVLQLCNLMFSHICIRWTSGKPLHDTDGSKKDGDAMPLSSSMAALLLSDGAAVSRHLVSNMPTALFYWPLMQLAASTMDDTTLSIAVGSGGGGNVPGGASDVRCALLLLLIGKCTLQQSALEEVGEEFFRSLLDDTDARIAYFTASFLIKRMMVEEPDAYQRMLHDLVFKAQQSNNEKLLENPYLQLRGILQLAATDPRG